MGKSNKILFYTNVLTKLQIISEEEKETILKKMTKKG
ncbi:DNA-directed RNA polymerase subunit H (RpoH/RPB5) [Bacillus tianshenii]|uniref:DNA-directed RNA polymerase subunit H (RpoH/RPB5) n=1 Tax=Sutcliffiella tianshenii TaxID=1463404 RepID=A0ABS2P5K4_9BACI|nr:DNA-directed RNA polymerase subunit H (RpoH/RPB5) [Bacillus tianshenii]